jgi:hypothetical protein
MGTAGLTLGRVAQHHHMRDSQGRAQGLRRAGVNFVVQRKALRMLGELGVTVHAFLRLALCLRPDLGQARKHNKKRYLGRL